eukprot:7385253-Alexandrium_andersonii.AAC.1
MWPGNAAPPSSNGSCSDHACPKPSCPQQLPSTRRGRIKVRRRERGVPLPEALRGHPPCTRR